VPFVRIISREDDRVPAIDMRTVGFMMVLVDFLSAVLLAFLWMQARFRFRGMELWAIDFALQTGAMILLVLRGSIPDLLSIFTANVFIAGGTLIGYVGYGLFLGKPVKLLPNLALLAVFSALHYWFGIVNPDLGVRNLNIGSYLLLIDLQILWLLFKGMSRRHLDFMRAPAVAHLLFAALGCIRIVDFFLGPAYESKGNFFSSRFADSAGLIAYQILLIVLTYSLVIAVNKRIITSMQGEHEKFSKAFHGSPYAMVLIRMPDGCVVEANKGIETLAGYSASDLVGKKILELDLWENQVDRARVVEDLEQRGRAEEREIRLRRKDGSSATVLLTSEVILIEGEKTALVAITDISDRKKMEEEIRELSRRDPLTKVFNRRHAFEVLDAAVSASRQSGEVFAVAILDMDSFKGINDRYGHQAGDLALIRLVEVIAGRIGPKDVLARHGGEEFLVVFADSGKSGAATVMNAVLAEQRSSPIELGGVPVVCTFSCGVADSGEWEPDLLTSEAIIALADERLYEVKRSGKDRVWPGEPA